MKIGSNKTGSTGKAPDSQPGPAGESRAARSRVPSQQPADATMKRLSDAADAARKDLVAKAPLQTSLKDKLLVSRNRAAEVRQRIQDGYYSRPDVVRSIADRLADFMQP